MALFESYDRRINQINATLNKYGIKDIDEAKAICDAKGINPYDICEKTQPICFENAKWAYVVGAAIAIKRMYQSRRCRRSYRRRPAGILYCRLCGCRPESRSGTR